MSDEPNPKPTTLDEIIASLRGDDVKATTLAPVEKLTAEQKLEVVFGVLDEIAASPEGRYVFALICGDRVEELISVDSFAVDGRGVASLLSGAAKVVRAGSQEPDRRGPVIIHSAPAGPTRH